MQSPFRARIAPRCRLLFLDNVDQPKLLEPAQIRRLPATEWLHVIATTRLGEHELFGKRQDRAFLPVDELPEADALELIETYQPDGRFPSDAEREAAREIAQVLGCSVEAAKMRLHRARTKLRQMMEEHCDLFHDERNVLSCLPVAPDRTEETQRGIAALRGSAAP